MLQLWMHKSNHWISRDNTISKPKKIGNQQDFFTNVPFFLLFFVCLFSTLPKGSEQFELTVASFSPKEKKFSFCFSYKGHFHNQMFVKKGAPFSKISYSPTKTWKKAPFFCFELKFLGYIRKFSTKKKGRPFLKKIEQNHSGVT